MSDSAVKISIPEDLIRAMVGAAVVQQLGSPEEVASRMMTQVLMQKCKRPGGDSYGPEKPLIEWLFWAEAERIAREEVKAFMASNADEIRASLKKALKAPAYADHLARALVDLISEETNCRTSVSVSVALGPGK